MFDNQHTWNSNSRLPGILQMTSVQAPNLGKKIWLADKSDNHVLYCR